MTSEAAWGRISDIAEINPETTNSNWNGREIFYIDIASVGTGVYNSEPESMLYDEAPSRARRVVKHGDVLISTVRPNRRSMIQILNPAENTVASTGFALLRPKRKEDSDYLFGIICNKQFTLELEMLAYGAAYPAVSTDDICRPSVYLPGEEERDRVSRLLGPISELNQSKLSEILHEYISAIFRSWFIDFDPVKAKAEGKLPHGIDEETAALFPNSFENSELGPIPAGWNWGKLGDCISVVGGGTPSTKNEVFWDGEYNWTSPKDLSNSNSIIMLDTEKTITEAGLAKVSSGLLPKDTVLMSSRAPIGYLALTKIPVAVNQGYIAIPPKNNMSPNFILSWIYYNMPLIEAYSSGATFPEISKKGFRKLPILIPPTELIEKFNEKTTVLYNSMEMGLKQRNSLMSVRDTLLPRLMSGELELPMEA